MKKRKKRRTSLNKNGMKQEKNGVNEGEVENGHELEYTRKQIQLLYSYISVGLSLILRKIMNLQKWIFFSDYVMKTGLHLNHHFASDSRLRFMSPFLVCCTTALDLHSAGRMRQVTYLLNYDNPVDAYIYLSVSLQDNLLIHTTDTESPLA